MIPNGFHKKLNKTFKILRIIDKFFAKNLQIRKISRINFPSFMNSIKPHITHSLFNPIFQRDNPSAKQPWHSYFAENCVTFSKVPATCNSIQSNLPVKFFAVPWFSYPITVVRRKEEKKKLNKNFLFFFSI